MFLLVFEARQSLHLEKRLCHRRRYLLTAIAWPTPHQSAIADSFSSRRSLLLGRKNVITYCIACQPHSYKSLLPRDKVSSRSETDEGNFLPSDFSCVFIPTPNFH